jgi:hypothetical protein
MGYVQKVSSGTYNARWRDPDGRLRCKAFDLEREARRYLKLRESEVIRGVYVDDRAGKVSFAEWAEHCMAIYEKKLSRTSYARDRSYCRSSQGLPAASTTSGCWSVLICG